MKNRHTDWFGRNKKIPTYHTTAVSDEDLKKLLAAYQDYKTIKQIYPKSFNLPISLERELTKCLEKYHTVLN